PLDNDQQRGVNPIRRRITVTASTRRFTPPDLAQPFDVALFRTAEPATAQLRLLGLVTPAPTVIDVNTPITVTLAWQLPETASTPTVDLATSVQLLDQANQPVTQSDGMPGGATSALLPGQVLTQTVTLPGVPAPGTYRLIVATYDPQQPGNPRLVTATGEDFVELVPSLWVP
ncbi:MAG: hypothetical protein KDE31_11710, partial [Caldilineaceae bacterium]|nr:hypothetical protein [Caldilineaceae bacterium]